MLYFEIEVFFKTETKSFAPPRLSIKSEVFSDAVKQLSETLSPKSHISNITMWQIGTGLENRQFDAIWWHSYGTYTEFSNMVLKTLGMDAYKNLPYEEGR